MSDFEQQLRRRLVDGSASVTPLADLEDLVERIATDRARRRRTSAFALALVAIVLPMAGFGLARVTDGSASKPVPLAAKVATRAPKFAPTPLPALKARGVPSATLADALGNATAPAGPDTRMLVGPYAELNLGRMFARTSGDGVLLRVYGARLPAQASDVPWFTPAPWCSPNRLVQVDTSNGLVAGTSQGYLYQAPKDGLVASLSFVGASEGSPVWVAVVQSDQGTTARATFVDGGTDSMALDGGIAVLGHAGGDATDLTKLEQQKVHVEILDASGSVVAETSVDAEGSPANADGQDANPADCTPPAKLPAPGAEQPADVVVATAGVTQAFTDVFSGASPVATREAAIDDPSGLDGVYAQLLGGTFSVQVKTAVPQVRGVVFLSATQAAVAFDISIPNYSDFNGRFGEAVLTGGRWKVTRTTFCTAVTLAAVTCPS